MLHPRPLIQFLIIQISTHLHPPPPAATASREHLNSVGLNVCMQKTAAGVQRVCSAAGCCMTSVMCLCRVMNEEKCSQGQSWDLQSYQYQWMYLIIYTSSGMSVSASSRSSHQYPCIWRPGWRYQPRVKTVHCA